MDDIERVLAENACENLCKRFHNMIDAYRFKEVLAMFAPDAVWRHRTGERRGAREIETYLSDKSTYPITRHLVSNIVIDVLDAAHARGAAYVAIYYAEPNADGGPAILNPPVALVQYADEFVRLPQGWRFKTREPKMIFRHPTFADMILTKADEANRRP